MNVLAIIVNIVTLISLAIVLLSLAGGAVVIVSYVLTEVHRIIVYIMKMWLYLLPPAVAVLVIKACFIFY